MKNPANSPVLKVKGIGVLSIEYETTYKTMRKMLEKVPGLQLKDRTTKYFDPKEVEMIYHHLGVPNVVLGE